jgi:zinc finger BED domain-containing protein 5/7/8/9
VAKLAYMGDIISLLNELNMCLRGLCTNIFTRRNKVNAFKMKLSFWDSRVQEEDIEMFPLLQEFLIAADVNRKDTWIQYNKSTIKGGSSKL